VAFAACALLMVALMRATTIVAAAISHQRKAAQAAPENAMFSAIIPQEPAANQAMTIQPTESAFISVATLKTEVPLRDWEALGWKVGNAIGDTEAVPSDCALHARRGVARQVYAVCQGPVNVSIPQGGGDFIYVVFTGSNHRILRMFRAGALYNPDSARLIP
jgi:hypothetical protein